MTIALTRRPSSSLSTCEVTYVPPGRINHEFALQQYESYCQALREMGIEVQQLSPLEAYPDSVFIEDNAIVLDELAVVTTMGVSSRLGEVTSLRPILSQCRRVFDISPPATIEGGDVLRMGKRLFVGRSSRTNHFGVEALRAIVTPLGYEVLAVGIQQCLHLKTACTPLDEETLLVNPAWLDMAVLKPYRFVPVPSTEPFGANVLCLAQGILANAQYPRTVALIEKKWPSVRAVDLSEFSKAEAGVTCLSLIMN